MTIRTKIWLIAVSVAMAVGVASWGRLYLTRARIIKDAQTSAEELARDIAEDLKSVEADADDRDLEEKLLGYLNRHSRIVRLDLYVNRESSTPSSRIAAPRGDRPEITRFAPFNRQPLGLGREAAGEAQVTPIELPVDLKGPWKATLVMRWSLGPVEAMLKTEERISLIFGIGLLVVLTLLSGLITGKVVGRPLEVLAGAMRDVEGGDLSRRVPVETVDEVGRLSQGFNRMLERLSQADAQIRAFNLRLAREIEAATRDLSDKNATLGQLNRLLNETRLENASKVRLATLGQLAAQLAHEIGTPLSSVSGHVQLALLERTLNAPLRERLEVAAREIERISRIVRDYLDSTRPLEPERRVTALPRLLEEAIELTRGVEPSDGALQVDCQIDPQLGELVTDPGLLRQIIVNLLSNAFDAVDRRGRVTLAANAAGDDVLITITDTGHGIAPDDLRRIFEPFYTTKGRGKGTGLGLAICRQLTAALGGAISVESTPGAGSTFFVRLPRSTAPAPASSPAGTKSEPRLRLAGGGGAVVTRVLVAEDDRVARDLLCEILRGEGFTVEAVDDGAGAIERAAAERYDLVVSDVRMERSSGLEVLKAFTDKAPGTPVILITAFGDVTGAMEAIQRGAYDYVSKPFNIEELKLTVARALERRRLVAENKTVQSEPKTHIEDIVGKSAVMLEVYKLVARVAASSATVLVTGESGSGKELVARAIHTHSPRARAAFVPVNCTALTESLLESELFGHAKGAFTGAIGAKRGLFEMASGGTLFLDEIGDMGPKMQAQLLRTLQDGEVRPVGGTESIRVDVRLVCATNRDLEEEVKTGRFREDLYFRINVVTVRLPPLRDRREDVPILVAHFLAKLARRERREQAALSPEALRMLSGYTWPGNVRELENAIDRAVAVAKGNVILPSDLPPEVGGAGPAAAGDGGGIIEDRPTLAELERRYIALVLGESGGNKKKAAERLGIDRRTLYRALERTGADAGDPDEDD